MIHQFRNFTPLNLIFLAPFAIVMCLGAFANLPPELRPTLFEPAILNLIGNFHEQLISPHVNVILSVVLTFLQAMYLNKVVNKYNLLGKSSFLPALIYVSLASMLTPFLILSPTLVCNFLLIGMIDKLLGIYYQMDNKAALFDLGIIIGVGTLFYFPFIAMLPILWISLLIFKPFNWREWLSGLIGFSTIYFILFIIYFWFGRQAEFHNIWLPLTQLHTSSLSLDFHDYLALIIPTIILLLFIIELRKSFFRSIVHMRKSFQLLFYIFILGVASFYLNHTLQVYHFLLCVPPVSIYMSYYFNTAKIRWLYEGLFALMILGFIYFQWF